MYMMFFYDREQPGNIFLFYKYHFNLSHPSLFHDENLRQNVA